MRDIEQGLGIEKLCLKGKPRMASVRDRERNFWVGEAFSRELRAEAAGVQAGDMR